MISRLHGVGGRVGQSVSGLRPRPREHIFGVARVVRVGDKQRTVRKHIRLKRTARHHVGLDMFADCLSAGYVCPPSCRRRPS
eukprot:scaffold24823_cov33-Phaeocystis_antarctica.AAC.1